MANNSTTKKKAAAPKKKAATKKPQAPKKVAEKVNGKLVIVEQLHRGNALVGLPAQYIPAKTEERTTAKVLPAQVASYNGKGAATLVVFYGESPKMRKADLLTDKPTGQPQWQLVGA